MFAQRLKELRKLNGLSQAALSSLLGVTQQAVGKWETGRSTPDPQTLARVAAYFKVSTDYLLGCAPPLSHPPLRQRMVPVNFPYPLSAQCAQVLARSPLKRTTARNTPA